MAKKAKRRAQAAGVVKGAASQDDQGAYFFLVNLTPSGKTKKDVVIRKEQQTVTNIVSKLGGTCELYSVHGPHDFISRVTGVSMVGAIQIAKAIEAGGSVTAAMVPAFHTYK